MGQPPELSDEAIVAALRANYGLAVRSLRFLPLGADADSAAYRVEAAGGSLFLKVRTRAWFSRPSLLIPHYLERRGIPHIVAPRPALSGALGVRLNGFTLSLYPFIQGRTGADAGLSNHQWATLGATMRQIHTTRLPPDLAAVMPRERYIPSRRQLFPRLAAAATGPTAPDAPASGPAARELARFWLARRDLINRLLERADELGRQLRRAALPPVLCHADLHTWNVLLDEAGQLWLVDWDETILAPKERDLMFVVEGIGPGLIRPAGTAGFLRGYGAAAINHRALVYYRYAWAVQDLAAYGEQVFLTPSLNETTRYAAAAGFRDLFEPGRIVALALASDDLPG